MAMNVVLIALSEAALDLARRLATVLPGAEVHGLAGRTDGADRAFDDAGAHVRTLFLEGRPVVGICAAGILVRLLAPVLGHKSADPPVVAVAEDGTAVVPLLGGHHGANALARRVAAATSGIAALTTAGDGRLGFALDDPPPGWQVEPAEKVKPVTAALLAGEPVRLIRDPGLDWPPADPFCGTEGGLTVAATDRTDLSCEEALFLRPPTLTLGIGCERDVAPETATAAVADALSTANLARGSLAGVGSIEVKADEPAVHAVADGVGVPLRLFPAARLEAETPRLANPSDLVFRTVGCHGVAEAAALALAGEGAELVVPKRAAHGVTVAIARAARPLQTALPGRAPGRLFVVGIGPGTGDWRTIEAIRALRTADHVVGYDLYLELAADLIGGAERHAFPLGEEQARVTRALDLAATGQDVALVCSGDPGIYALATLVFETVEAARDRARRGVAVTVVPGISALQAAAARAGAPLGHDFCAVSLSDLLTPRAQILARVRAAADGDFVAAFFNPQSRRRRTLLDEAVALLRAARPAGTPVLVARNLGRAGETTRITPLDRFDPDDVDMLSLVIVGNSESRIVATVSGDRVMTPRGYAAGGTEKAAGA